MKKLNQQNAETSISIGEMAKKTGVTVRTLQYYDKQGILVPGAVTAGGRRFYTKHDIVKLHQILSMKYLGFSLDDIKNHLVELDTKQDVIQALELQSRMLREQSERLKEVLSATEILRQEVEQMQSVDFDRYAKIILMLRQKSESYWMFKLLSDKLSSHVKNHFSENPDAWASLYKRWESACDMTILLNEQGENPQSEKAQELAKEWWNMTLEFSGGDLSLLGELQKFEENTSGWNEKMKRKIPLIQDYRKRLLQVYWEKEKVSIKDVMSGDFTKKHEGSGHESVSGYKRK